MCVCTVAKRAQKIVNLFFMPSSKFTAILVLHSVAVAAKQQQQPQSQSATLYRRSQEGEGAAACVASEDANLSAGSF